MADDVVMFECPRSSEGSRIPQLRQTKDLCRQMFILPMALLVVSSGLVATIQRKRTLHKGLPGRWAEKPLSGTGSKYTQAESLL